jgi:hypothetical protein
MLERARRKKKDQERVKVQVEKLAEKKRET